MYQLEGKTCVVTGGEGPLGRAVALALADAGCDIAIVCAKDTEPTEQISALIKGEHRKVRVYEADVQNADSMRSALNEAHDEFGVLQVLVHVCDESGDAKSHESSSQNVADILLNPMVEAGWGRVIVVTPPQTSPTGASTDALTDWAASLARSVASKSITVNCVVPGVIDLSNTNGGAGDQGARPDTAQIPAGRAGEPAEVAHAVVFLASPGASYITGQRLCVNGGLCAGR